MICSNCAESNREGIKFCENCGAELSLAGRSGDEATRASASEPEATELVAQQASAVGSQAVVVSGQPASNAVIGGGIILAASAFLPWFATPGVSSSGFEVPFELIYDRGALPGGLSIGPFVLGLGLIAIGLSYLNRFDWVQRIVGLLAAVAAVAVAVQFGLVLSDEDVLAEIFSFMSFGLYAAVAGGALVALFPRR